MTAPTGPVEAVDYGPRPCPTCGQSGTDPCIRGRAPSGLQGDAAVVRCRQEPYPEGHDSRRTVNLSDAERARLAALNPFLTGMRRRSISAEDMLWAIQRGASRPNDKRSKALMGMSNIGASCLKPYEGDWYVHHERSPQGQRVFRSLDQAELVLTRLIRVRGLAA